MKQKISRKIVRSNPTWADQANDYLQIRIKLFGDLPLKRGQSVEIYEAGKSKGLDCSYSHFKKLLPLAEFYSYWQKSSLPRPTTKLWELGEGIAIAAIMDVAGSFDSLNSKQLEYISKKIDAGKFGARDIHTLSEITNFSVETDDYQLENLLSGLPIEEPLLKKPFLSKATLDNQDIAQYRINHNFSLQRAELALKTIGLGVYDHCVLRSALPFSIFGIEVLMICRLSDLELINRPEETLPSRELKLCVVARTLNPKKLAQEKLAQLAKTSLPVDLILVLLLEPITPYDLENLKQVAQNKSAKIRKLENELGNFLVIERSEHGIETDFSKELIKAAMHASI